MASAAGAALAARAASPAVPGVDASVQKWLRNAVRRIDELCAHEWMATGNRRRVDRGRARCSRDDDQTRHTGGVGPRNLSSERLPDARALHALHHGRSWPECQRRPASADQVKPTGQVESLQQLVARSTREIRAHTSELGLQLTSRYFIDQAAQLIAALRLWTESRFQSDKPLAEMLKDIDIPALRDAARQLREMGTADARIASWTIELNTNRTSGELFTIVVTALAALE